MGKKQKSQSKSAAGIAGENVTSTFLSNRSKAPTLSFLNGENNVTAIDPMLVSLFEKSAGPVTAPQFTSANLRAATVEDTRRCGKKGGKEPDFEQDAADATSSDEEDQTAGRFSLESSDEGMEDVNNAKLVQRNGRKRKRAGADDLEGAYMQRIVKEEAKEEEKRRIEKPKRRKFETAVENDSEPSASESDEEENSESESDGISSPPPVHESLTDTVGSAVLDKTARTVFLSNVSTEAIKSKAAKKALLKHLSSFFPSLPDSTTPHKIESIRFRSTAFSTNAMPKRAAYAKRELMDSTTRSTNAYVVYTTTAAARRAPKALNGSFVLDRHLRVDSVAHPSPIDYKRCIFVGNLGFVDEETPTDEKVEQQTKKKNTQPADVEEGLWRTFNEHTRSAIAKLSKSPAKSKGSDASNTNNPAIGTVESVRVIRDPATRIGKGIAYVQFHDENAVEAALLLDGQKFPPMLPRKLRVTRAKRVVKKAGGSAGNMNNNGRNAKNSKDANKTALGPRRGGDKQASSQGGATGLLGKGEAWKVQNSRTSDERDGKSEGCGSNSFIFEGYRATADKPAFKVKTKSRGVKSRGGKSKTRSTRRAAAFRAGGGKRKGDGQWRKK
ncbi:hypothetical protein GX48_01303 [Paracoccidioides brasiliensis]|nr:hypothetical protein GX48_01303 [Paracoccidioides brasiliensis]